MYLNGWFTSTCKNDKTNAFYLHKLYEYFCEVIHRGNRVLWRRCSLHAVLTWVNKFFVLEYSKNIHEFYDCSMLDVAQNIYKSELNVLISWSSLNLLLKEYYGWAKIPEVYKYWLYSCVLGSGHELCFFL